MKSDLHTTCGRFCNSNSNAQRPNTVSQPYSCSYSYSDICALQCNAKREQCAVEIDLLDFTTAWHGADHVAVSSRAACVPPREVAQPQIRLCGRSVCLSLSRSAALSLSRSVDLGPLSYEHIGNTLKRLIICSLLLLLLVVSLLWHIKLAIGIINAIGSGHSIIRYSSRSKSKSPTLVWACVGMQRFAIFWHSK